MQRASRPASTRAGCTARPSRGLHTPSYDQAPHQRWIREECVQFTREQLKRKYQTEAGFDPTPHINRALAPNQPSSSVMGGDVDPASLSSHLDLVAKWRASRNRLADLKARLNRCPPSVQNPMRRLLQPAVEKELGACIRGRREYHCSQTGRRPVRPCYICVGSTIKMYVQSLFSADDYLEIMRTATSAPPKKPSKNPSLPRLG